MRYEKGHKDLTRRRIVEVASRQFREHGVAAVGIAGIMSDAGLTNGAFYAHFDSKEDLVREVLSHAGFRNKLSKAAENGTGLAGAIRDYLSQNHRDNPGGGCPTSALVAEIARHPKATRDAFTGKVGDVIELIAAALDAGTESGAAAKGGCDLRADGGHAATRPRRQRQAAVRRDLAERRRRGRRAGRPDREISPGAEVRCSLRAGPVPRFPAPVRASAAPGLRPADRGQTRKRYSRDP